MVSHLDHLSILQDDDAIGFANGGKAVGDHKPGAVLQQFDEGFLNEHLGVAVDICRGLVKNEDLGIGDQCAGKADQLALAKRKISTTLAQFSLVSLGKIHDELMCADSLGRLDDIVE